jgi:hypothetical protein
LNINVVTSNIKIQGLTDKIKTIYNTRDVNFKFISFPIKYNIIIHPMFPLTITPPGPGEVNLKKDKTINKSIITELSFLEISFIFIFLFSYLSIFSFFIYKIY